MFVFLDYKLKKLRNFALGERVTPNKFCSDFNVEKGVCMCVHKCLG